MPWRRERLPTPVFWPRGFHGQYGPWGRRVRHDWTTFTSLHFQLSTAVWCTSPWCRTIYDCLSQLVLDWAGWFLLEVSRAGSVRRDWGSEYLQGYLTGHLWSVVAGWELSGECQQEFLPTSWLHVLGFSSEFCDRVFPQGGNEHHKRPGRKCQGF